MFVYFLETRESTAKADLEAVRVTLAPDVRSELLESQDEKGLFLLVVYSKAKLKFVVPDQARQWSFCGLDEE